MCAYSQQVDKVISLELIFLKRSGKFNPPKRVLVYSRPAIVRDVEEDSCVNPGNGPGSAADGNDGIEDGQKMSEGVNSSGEDGKNPFEDGHDEDDDGNPFDGEYKPDHHEDRESRGDGNTFGCIIDEEKGTDDVEDELNPFAEDLDETVEDGKIPSAEEDRGKPRTLITVEGISSDFDDTNPFSDDDEDDDANPFGDDSTNPFGEEDDDVSNPFGEDEDESNPFAEDMAAVEKRTTGGKSLTRGVSMTLEGVTLDESSVDASYVEISSSTRQMYNGDGTNPFENEDDAMEQVYCVEL